MSVRDNRWAPQDNRWELKENRWELKEKPLGTDQDNRWAVGVTFKLLESKVRNATYFHSVLGSKREDYLIWSNDSNVHQDPAVFPKLPHFSEVHFSKVYSPKVYFSKAYLSKVIFFAKSVQLACLLLRFASFFQMTSLIDIQYPSVPSLRSNGYDQVTNYLESWIFF